nr:MAG TPA: hypothetical protein [Caudoviricetes sp.]
MVGKIIVIQMILKHTQDIIYFLILRMRLADKSYKR